MIKGILILTANFFSYDCKMCIELFNYFMILSANFFSYDCKMCIELFNYFVSITNFLTIDLNRAYFMVKTIFWVFRCCYSD